MAQVQPQQPRNRILEKANAALVVFADSLSPSDTYLKDGNQKVDKVFKAIQREKQLSIAKIFIGGSVGKKTSVIYPDFDCVVLMNNRVPPLIDLVNDFEKIMRKNADELEIVENTLKTTNLTVMFEFNNGAEVDLLPACSFYQYNEEVQYREVLQRIRANPELSPGYSSSLAQTQIRFMKTQSPTTHQLVRIAKYWYKLCTFDDKTYGGSSIMEILCVVVADELGSSFPMLSGFKRFLHKILDIKRLQIAFYWEDQKFKRIHPEDLILLIYRSHFDEDILDRDNFIIEPANPYNDLAKNISDETFKRMKIFATEMLNRLGDLESLGSNEIKAICEDGRNIKVSYDKLFEPFIMVLRDYYDYSAIPTYICITYWDGDYNTAHVNADVRGAGEALFANNKPAKSVYKTVMNNLLFLIRGKAARNTTTGGLSFSDGIVNIDNEDDIKTAVTRFINSNFGVKKFVVESTSHWDHLNYHVTLSIPYRLRGKIYALRFSMKWSS